MRGAPIVAGPPAAAFAHQHERQAQLLRSIDQAVRLFVALVALCAGKHRPVIRHDRRPARLLAVQARVDRPQPGDDAVVGAEPQKLVAAAARALVGQGEHAVFDETALIDQIGDVLARGAHAQRVPLGHRAGPALVGHRPAAFEHLGQIGADMIGIGRFSRAIKALVRIARKIKEQRLSRRNRITRRGKDRGNLAAGLAAQLALHLHGLDHRDRLAGDDPVAQPHAKRMDHARHRCGNRRSAGDRGPFRLCPHRLRPPSPAKKPGFALIRCQLGDVVLDKVGVDRAAGKFPPRNNRAQQRQVGCQTLDAEFGQRARCLARGIGKGALRRVDDQLGAQGIEGRTKRKAAIGRGIYSHARTGRHLERRDRARFRAQIARRRKRLGIYAQLDGKAARRGRRGRVDPGLRQRCPLRQPDLRRDQIDARHFLGNGMLHLKARIGLDKGKPRAMRALRHKELEGAKAAIPGLARHQQRGIDDHGARCTVKERAWRDLDQLLVAALDGAFPLAQMRDFGAVADHLHLDMARARQQFLGIDRAIAERALRLGPAGSNRPGNFAGLAHDAHAAPAATRRRLDDNRRAGAKPGKERADRLGRSFVRAPDHRHAQPLGKGEGAGLVAEQFKRGRVWPDEGDTALRAQPGEGGILAQKAVAGMDRGAAVCRRKGDDLFRRQIGCRAAPRKCRHAIGGLHMQRKRVIGGMDAHGAQAKRGCGASDADGDFAAVGDEDREIGHILSGGLCIVLLSSVGSGQARAAASAEALSARSAAQSALAEPHRPPARHRQLPIRPDRSPAAPPARGRSPPGTVPGGQNRTGRNRLIRSGLRPPPCRLHRPAAAAGPKPRASFHHRRTRPCLRPR